MDFFCFNSVFLGGVMAVSRSVNVFWRGRLMCFLGGLMVGFGFLMLFGKVLVVVLGWIQSHPSPEKTVLAGGTLRDASWF